MVGPDLKVCGAGPPGPAGRCGARPVGGARERRAHGASVSARGARLWASARARRAEPGRCARFGDPPARNWAPPRGLVGRVPAPRPRKERRKGGAPSQLQPQPRSGPRWWCLDSAKPEPRPASRSGGGSARGPRASPPWPSASLSRPVLVKPPSPLRAAPFRSCPALRFGNLHFLVCRSVQQMLATVDSLKELGLTIGG